MKTHKNFHPNRNTKTLGPRMPALGHMKLHFRSILVPVDFSKQSEDALRYALAFAKVFHSQIILLHATESLMPQGVPYPSPWMLKPTDIIADSKRRLQEWLRTNKLDQAPVSRIIGAEGKPFETIGRFAKKLKVDLIIISTHGYSGFERLFLGSTTERVVRHTCCPVLVVRHRTAGLGKKRIQQGAKRVLIPTDFSPNSVKALQFAAAILHRFKGAGTLFHAVHPNFYFTGADDEAVAYAQLLKDVQDSSAKQIQALRDGLKSRGLRVNASIATGDPRKEIIALAKQLHSDLIVLATHGWTGLKHAFLGSVAEYIVRRAPAAVLVVR